MKRALCILIALAAFVPVAQAQGLPAAQDWTAFGNWNIVFEPNRWIHLNKIVLKMPEQKDLFMNVTFECGVLEGSGATPFADALIRVAVTVDGVTAFPGRFEACGKTNGLEVFPQSVSCTGTSTSRVKKWSDCGVSSASAQEDRIKRSLRSHTTNFILKDVGVGQHTVTIQVFLWNGEPSDNPVRGLVGDVSLQTSIVRLIKDR
jgi:hypothetical protein